MKHIRRLWAKIRYNEGNSTLSVKCTAPGKCDLRKTACCRECKRNKADLLYEKSYFVPRKDATCR